jgi:transcription termination/antitermination protein NusA
VNIDVAALKGLVREKDVSFDTVVEAIESALLAAYQRTEGSHARARVELDRKTGECTVWAQEVDSSGEVVRETDDTPSDFGRIAAMTAKQVIMSRLRDVALVITVHKCARGAQVTLSRSHPNLVRKLFAMEVPEIADGTVEIAAVAREAGHRSKVAVRSNDPAVRARGACIGPLGARVRAVVTELHGEKIDIVDWDPDPATFVGNALSPAAVRSVTVVDAASRSARVIVPDFQLSLAIGKEGQNARLANRLTGWRIDIRPDTEATPAAQEAGQG